MSLDLDLHPEGTPPPHDPVPPRPSRTRLWLALIGCVLILALGVWFVGSRLARWLNSAPTAGVPAPTAGAAADTRRIQATLFYVSADGAGLVPVTHDVVFGATPAEQARRIVEAHEACREAAGGPDAARYYAMNGVFHEAIRSAAGNAALAQEIASLDKRLSPYRRFITFRPGRTATALREDSELIDTLAARALPGAAADSGLRVPALEVLDAPVRRRVIRAWLLAGGATGLTDKQIRGVDTLVTGWHGQGGVAVGSSVPDERLFAGRRDGVLTLWREPVGKPGEGDGGEALAIGDFGGGVDHARRGQAGTRHVSSPAARRGSR